MTTLPPGGWIAVDLDGTLAHYDGWRGPHHIGPPIADMATRVRRWLEEGRDVRIFTARVADGPLAVAEVEAWSLLHLGRRLVVTNVKDRFMIELWDDRAVQVVRNTGVPISAALLHLASMVAPHPDH